MIDRAARRCPARKGAAEAAPFFSRRRRGCGRRLVSSTGPTPLDEIPEGSYHSVLPAEVPMPSGQTAFDELSVAEQILHVQELWDRIAANPKRVPVTKAQRAELRRRLAAHRADPERVVSWSEARRRIRRKR